MASVVDDPPTQTSQTEIMNGYKDQVDDPFSGIPTQPHNSHPHRYSSFDTQLFALNHPSATPSQAKLALEAHLTETERRLQDASKLGTALVQQRKDLTERLKEIDLQQVEGDISPELRQKLVEIEKEYNEIGRESARAFLAPKSNQSGAEETASAPFALDGRRPPSPTKFSSQASDSPSKLNAPSSRKSRNQPSSRVHDIEFATQISTSLLAQVRNLQTVLAERDDTLKTVNSEKSRLEIDAQGFSQRLRSLDESEQRYKDENWSLETQNQELLAAAKEAGGREQRLQQSLAVLTSERNYAQRELDDLKQANDKLAEDHTAARRSRESELADLKKEYSMGENEKFSMQRQIDELTSQNHELAKAVADHFSYGKAEPVQGFISESQGTPVDRSGMEHSPPPSPTKATSKHNVLESETLKSSLHHAHRMIQTLKNNINREKTEKAELKRILQEVRDDLDMRKTEVSGSNNGNKRAKIKSQNEPLRRSARPGALGAGRRSKTDVMLDEDGWLEHSGEGNPDRGATAGSLTDERATKEPLSSTSDAYQTANESEDAFETANEKGGTTTEEDRFQTGAESMAGDSSNDDTETEDAVNRRNTIRGKKMGSAQYTTPVHRSSMISTASTSADEDEEDDDAQGTKTSSLIQPQRYRLKMNRGSRRSQMGNEGLGSSNPSSVKNSPASFASSADQGGQTLFAELGELTDPESGEENNGTPSRKSIASMHSVRRSSPGSRLNTSTTVGIDEPPVPRLPMVDSSMMTEPGSPYSDVLPSPSHRANQRVSRSMTDTSFTRESGVQSHPLIASESPSSVAAPSPTPRTVWDQPLRIISANIPTFGPTPRSTSKSIRSPSSQGPNTDTTLDADLSSSALSFSSIQSLETTPLEHSPGILSNDREKPFNKKADSNATSLGGTGILGSVFGWGRKDIANSPQIAEDETSQVPSSSPTPKDGSVNLPLGVVSGNIASGESRHMDHSDDKVATINMADQSSQTVLSFEELDNLLREKEQRSSGTIAEERPLSPAAMSFKPLSDIGAVVPTLKRDQSSESVSSLSRARNKISEPIIGREAAPLVKSTKRKGSASSIRAAPGAFPPLPPDHRQAIAAAAQKGPSTEGPPTTMAPPAFVSPPTASASVPHPNPEATQVAPSAAMPGLMGPPLAPASAYRPNISRPRTPSEQREQREPATSHTSRSRTGTGPRTRYSTTRSQISRRSSVSSFASELDQRFNIRADGMPMPHGLDSNTDPRMIQAITQTMIGEYLWKYTRKAGRGEMSDNRHRRFFWVHPYTRTLYWSDRDPTTAGRAQLKAKSVAIEAVRVVTDDNPMPPGLHRKSLVIITPGRVVKFTATTGQRHETWFNALSYLLLRTGPDGSAIHGPNEMTAEDVAEFNPSSRNPRYSRTAGSRISLSSYGGRNNHGQSPQPRNESSMSMRRPPSVNPMTAQSTANGRHSQARHSGSISSRFSSYWKPASTRGSVSSRQSDSNINGGGSVYNGSVVHDSTDDLRQTRRNHDQDSRRLENVRACCDGKHDVGSLAHQQGSTSSRHGH